MAVQLWSDIACPWATVFVVRWQAACERAGVSLPLEHHAFPLELVNERPTPKLILEAEIPVAGALVPDFEMRLWTAPDFEWPVTTLLALEAVQAAREQRVEGSDALDAALREALFVDGRCISMRHVVLDVAHLTDGVDVDALAAALDDGRCRTAITDDLAEARTGRVKGSPHVFLPDGSDAHNPGITLHWEGTAGDGGYPIVDSDDASVVDSLVATAAAASSS
jgi:predicted DsbA family dithiol-disulfide isomerase